MTASFFVQDGRESNIRVRLPMGKYCIIPSTFMPDQEGDFILRDHDWRKKSHFTIISLQLFKFFFSTEKA